MNIVRVDITTTYHQSSKNKSCKKVCKPNCTFLNALKYKKLNLDFDVYLRNPDSKCEVMR